MGHLILAQSHLYIPAQDDGGEHFVGTDQNLWKWTNVSSWILEEVIQIITK